MNYLDNIIVLLQSIHDNLEGSGRGDITKEEVQELINQAIISLRGGADPTITIKKLSDDIHTKIDNLSITYTIDEWNDFSDEEKETIKSAYDTVYITGDVSDWCEKPTITTDYPMDNIPIDNTFYELGVRSELIIAEITEHCCASITLTTSESGLTLGLGQDIEFIGDIPETFNANIKLFIGIINGKLYINEITTKTE